MIRTIAVLLTVAFIAWADLIPSLGLRNVTDLGGTYTTIKSCGSGLIVYGPSGLEVGYGGIGENPPHWASEVSGEPVDFASCNPWALAFRSGSEVSVWQFEVGLTVVVGAKHSGGPLYYNVTGPVVPYWATDVKGTALVCGTKCLLVEVPQTQYDTQHELLLSGYGNKASDAEYLGVNGNDYAVVGTYGGNLLVTKLADPSSVVSVVNLDESVVSVDVCDDLVVAGTTAGVYVYKFDGSSLTLLGKRSGVQVADVTFLKPSCDILAVLDVQGKLMLFSVPALDLLYERDMGANSLASQWGKLYLLEGSKVYEYEVTFEPVVVTTSTVTTTTTTVSTVFTATNTTTVTSVTTTTTMTTSVTQTVTTTTFTSTTLITTTTKTIRVTIPAPLLLFLLPKLVIDRTKDYFKSRE